MMYLPNDDNIEFGTGENLFLDNNLIILKVNDKFMITSIDDLNITKYFLDINN